MEKIKIENSCDILSWCPDPEEEALEQMKTIAKLPYVRHVAWMPDGHLGQNMCIGGVVATEGIVVPDFVGVDIGCGVGAFRTSLKKEDVEDLDLRRKLLHSFSRSIPVGFSHNTDKRRNELKNKYGDKIKFIIEKSKVGELEHNPVGNYEKEIASQLGTLGSGNHFCELQYDEDGYVWIMLHSGSRNIGKRVGDYFNALATKLNDMWLSSHKEIPFLAIKTDEGKSYLAWMDFALRFAYLNRKVMLDEIKDCLQYEFPKIKFTTKELVDDSIDNVINIHHNFASLENHFNKNLWVFRKGATRAFSDQTGIIPGSMGTSSYIVKGKGNKASLMSCSHGAGRNMGRRAFSRKMKHSHDQIEKSLENVVHSDFGEFSYGKDKGLKDVSEAPQAYKDIESVMENQKDLVDPIVKLQPLVCMKG